MPRIAIKPRPDARLSLRLPKSLLRDLLHAAAAAEATASDVARHCLADGVARLLEQRQEEA